MGRPKKDKMIIETSEAEYAAVLSGRLQVILTKNDTVKAGDDATLTCGKKYIPLEIITVIRGGDGLKKGWAAVGFERPFADFTKEEIAKNVQDYCSKCRFRTSVDNKTGCNYMEIMEHRRGCSPIECRRFKKGKQIKLCKGANNGSNKDGTAGDTALPEGREA